MGPEPGKLNEPHQSGDSQQGLVPIGMPEIPCLINGGRGIALVADTILELGNARRRVLVGQCGGPRRSEPRCLLGCSLTFLESVRSAIVNGTVSPLKLILLCMCVLPMSACNDLQPAPEAAAKNEQPAEAPTQRPSERLDTRLPADGSGSPRESSAIGSTPSAAPSGGQPPQAPLGTHRSQPFSFESSSASETPQTSPDQTQLMNRPFATLQPIESDAPDDLLQQLRTIDQAIGDLVTAGANEIVEKEQFVQYGLRLGNMKVVTGQKLANSVSASDEQRKAGLLATLIGLSHLSGIGDVASAKKLEELAETLATSSDPDLVHQSRIVLLGFALQALQNGLESDPTDLLAQAEGLFQRPEDQNFPEFMMLRQAIYVLTQMGFEQDAERIRQILIAEYQNSPDPQLRNDSWLFATEDSQALENFNVASQAIGSPSFNVQDLLAAARGLHEAFPTSQTLEQLAKTVANIEYGGFVDLSDQLAEWIRQTLDQDDATFAAQVARQLLAEHDARLGLVGQPLERMELQDLDGRPLDWGQYEGKVILIDFWATWCVPCLREIPNIREVYSRLSAEGFAVIAVNMDDSAELSRDFITQQNFPWKNYFFTDAAGFQSRFAKQHGLNLIPFIALVDRDGIVKQIHIRGQEIETAVREALGLETSLIP